MYNKKELKGMNPKEKTVELKGHKFICLQGSNSFPIEVHRGVLAYIYARANSSVRKTFSGIVAI